MKRFYKLLFLFSVINRYKTIILILLLSIFFLEISAQKVHTSYLWHLQQPNYWPAKSKANPNTYQKVKESNDLKNSGDSWNIYSDGKSYPLKIPEQRLVLYFGIFYNNSYLY